MLVKALFLTEEQGRITTKTSMESKTDNLDSSVTGFVSN